MRPYAEAATVKLFTRTFEPQPLRTDKQGFSEGRALTPAEREAIESKISLATWNGAPVMVGCCLPHHFLRYYDKAGRQIGEIAICFCCACIYGRPEPPGVAGNTALDFDPEALKAVMKGMGVRTDFGCEPAAADSPGA
ncbi:hypothetical protein CSW64_04900 [Caulobacter mirabilis]|uniref:Uncharacterized protein n=2 Tax=Caulobacter mirabilis TaxID=69666 RepID=A0A2D2AUY9_9CAUL|nr:hypothetical protein CSW64_04900 [Caulobacter mirabilis]